MAECEKKIDQRIQFGTIRTLSTANTFGIIDGSTASREGGTTPYLFVNHNGIYNNLNIGDKVFFFYCDKNIVYSLDQANNDASQLLAFNIHNHGNNLVALRKFSVERGTTNPMDHNGDESDGTITDLPPLRTDPNDPSKNAFYTITDCGVMILLEDSSNSQAWNWITFNAIGIFDSLTYAEKTADSINEWIHN